MLSEKQKIEITAFSIYMKYSLQEIPPNDKTTLLYQYLKQTMPEIAYQEIREFLKEVIQTELHINAVVESLYQQTKNVCKFCFEDITGDTKHYCPYG